LQNCPVFNDEAFKNVTDKEVRDDNVLYLEHGELMVFGKDRDKGFRLQRGTLEVVELDDSAGEEEILVHDETREDASVVFALSRLDEMTFPVPLGVFRAVERPTFEERLHAQVATAREKLGPGSIEALLKAADTWEVN
ncbi:MAG: 2-oxoacid:ferredoxin oxidoreductase subunit beta, partial [Candidatus Tectimicrobiota bacterium]